MISKDPKQLVNKIPLGPNAAMVNIVKVINKEASLWRPPSEDISVMGDALLVNIAWPLTKLSKCNGQRMEDAESESESDFSKEESNGAGVSFNKGVRTTSSKGARTSGSKEVEPTKESSPKVKLYTLICFLHDVLYSCVIVINFCNLISRVQVTAPTIAT